MIRVECAAEQCGNTNLMVETASPTVPGTSTVVLVESGWTGLWVREECVSYFCPEDGPYVLLAEEPSLSDRQPSGS